MLVPEFYLLLGALVALAFLGLQKAELPRPLRQKYLRNAVIGTALWLAYASALAATGFFQVFTVPPRIALFLILPLFAGMAYFFLSKKAGPLLRAVPPSWPVYIQTFRIAVECLLLGMFWKGLVSSEPTLEGYNFDMLAGSTAPIVAYLVFQRKAVPIQVLKIWNIAGLLLLANVVLIFNTLLLKPALWGYDVSPVRPEFGTMPYLLVAGVFMPFAVFMHVFSLAQIRRNKG